MRPPWTGSLVQRRSRRVVFWTLGVFAAVQALAAVLIERVWPVVRDPVHFSRLAYLERHRREERPDRLVLFLGSSRVLGIHAQTMSAALTGRLGEPAVVLRWSNVGCGPVRHLLTWDRLRRRGVRPDAVFLEVFLVQLNANRTPEDTDERHLPTNELDAADADLLLRYGVSRPWLREEQLIGSLFPLHSHRLNLVARAVPRLVDPAHRRYPDGCQDMRAEVSESVRAAAVRRMEEVYGGGMRDFAVGGVNCRALEDLVREVRKAGVPVVLLVMPEGPAFRGWYRPGAAEEALAYLEGVAAREGAGLIDSRSWCDDEGLFTDSLHLTDRGASRYSARLTREVVTPLMQRSNEAGHSATVRAGGER